MNVVPALTLDRRKKTERRYRDLRDCRSSFLLRQKKGALWVCECYFALGMKKMNI